MARVVRLLGALAVFGLVVFWFVTAPKPLDESAIAGLQGDATRGEQVFNAAGCASCHTAPDAPEEARLVLAGGQKFPSDFGTFIAPNISPSAEGIGGWSTLDLVNAVSRGVSPKGAHYFPAFPYTTYGNAELSDLVDLKAFLDTLPADGTPSQAHDVGFPFNIRRSLGGWKFLFADKGWVMEGDLSPELTRGRYLVEALGHCAECHTPRNALGGMDRAAWKTGAPVPGSDKGKVPAITPQALDWSAEDIAYYLESGFTPDFDSVGGHMVHVVENTSRLTPEDRAAIAAYLKALP